MFRDATPNDKKIFVANPAEGSIHDRGCAVDLTLYDLKTGAAVKMHSISRDSRVLLRAVGSMTFKLRRKCAALSIPFKRNGTLIQKLPRECLAELVRNDSAIELPTG